MKYIEIYNYETNKVIDTLETKKSKNIQKDVIDYLQRKNYSLWLQGAVSPTNNNVYWLARNKITNETLKIWYREKELLKDKEDNKLVLDYLGNDNWERPVYRVNQDDIYVKDTNLGDFAMANLCYSCPENDFYGEPDYEMDLKKYSSISVISSKGYAIPSNMAEYSTDKELV